ncbi:unnamed protein product [Spodoptera littoralis]|uniref:RWD domain-containing protein n=1 Tax=Spodoptera littoralis TaxID=7109 RepID=A0A9P0N227_SPOLI|nr:unnamed protein product [Spodoptera littoralis]CAH1641776.1 unnamed protein product [Spodoptera littoralis]
METDNLTKQDEEIEALSAIYGDDWAMESDKTRSYSIKILEKEYEVVLYVTMPEDYPSQSPPSYEFSAPWMDRKDKSELHQALDEIYLENIGECVVFQWVEKIREVLQTIKPKKRREVNERTKSKSPPTVSSDTSLKCSY